MRHICTLIHVGVSLRQELGRQKQILTAQQKRKVRRTEKDALEKVHYTNFATV